MWMSVLKKEHVGYMAGTMFAVVKADNNKIYAWYLNLDKNPPTTDDKRITIVVDDAVAARELFTKPTKDLSSLMEESVMVSESVYC